MISVLISVYNRFEGLRVTLDCIKRQQCNVEYEVILCDDGSTGIIEWLNENGYEGITVVSQEDLGFRLSRNRNNGVRESLGDFLIFLDQDFIVPDDFIQTVYDKRCEKSKICFLYCYLSEETSKKVTGLDYESACEVASEDEEYKMKSRILDMLLKQTPRRFPGLFACYKKDFIEYNGFDEGFIGWGLEDFEFDFRWLEFGGRNIVYDRVLLHLFHPYDNSKGVISVNTEYYNQRCNSGCKESKYGFFNTLGEDEYEVKYI